MKKRFFIFIALIAPFIWSNQSIAQNNPERFWKWMKKDPVSLVSDIGPHELLTIASFGAGVSILSLNDAASSRNIQQNYGHSSLLNFTNRWGDLKIAAPVSAGIFAVSLITDDTKFQDAAFTSLQALVMTNITVNTGKFLFARERPSSHDGPYDLDFAEAGATSFPSGHAATAFAVLTPWVIYYPGPITYTLMAIPVGTAVARVARGRHWLSDVTAGAGIGVSIGYYLARKHLDLQSDRVQIIPSAGQDNFAVTVNFSF